MRSGYCGCAVMLLALAGCGGTSGDATVSGADAATLQSAPAGVAILQFLDLMALRPDMVASGTPLPTGIVASTPSSGVTRYTFSSFPAANAGTLSGTIDVTSAAAAGGGTAYTETLQLTGVPKGSTSTSWAYSGAQVVTVTAVTGGNQAVYALANAGQPITLAYTDSANASNSKTYTYTPSLALDWTGSGASVLVTLGGSYLMAQTLPAADAKTLTGTLSPALTWTPACAYPTSGTLTLTLSTSSATATADFNTGACGQVRLNGGLVTLGS